MTWFAILVLQYYAETNSFAGMPTASANSTGHEMQHSMEPSTGATEKEPAPSHDHDMPMNKEVTTASKPALSMSGPLGLMMNREGSGTSWLPDTTPMHALHVRAGDWDLMVHGNVFVGYDVQGSKRGARQFNSLNSFMGMASHDLAGGKLQGRIMISLDPLTTGPEGYPLLLQSGETFRGRPLVDRQHPHDLFMETAVMYERGLSEKFGFQIYGGPAGEPTLGPAAFPHRESAMNHPLAPLSHHWQDSTHIAFGVVTAGLFTRYAKLEGSWFNGREPDEERHDFDLRKFDSTSGRFSLNPTDSLSLQASFGFLKSPETLEPDRSIHRTTGSLIYNRVTANGNWASSFIWGRNNEGGEVSDSYLAESNFSFNRQNSVFTRAEYNTKTAEELFISSFAEEEEFSFPSASFGYVRSYFPTEKLAVGLGLVGSVSFLDSRLASVYGTPRPAGVMAFVRFSPSESHSQAHEDSTPMQPGVHHSGHEMPNK